MARFKMLVLGCSLAALVAGNASAQTAPPPAPATADPAPEAEASTADNGDVVVTARFRTEAVRDVPIAITAVSGESLANRQLNNVETISASIPAVGFRGGASNKDRTVFIRGVGTITTSPGVEPSVSTVLDGVVLSRPGQSTLDLGELERIEVLRGPQGTLFGKNASAGVVNIVTREPSEDLQAFGELGATTDEEYRVKGGVSGALVPGKVRALIGGLYSDFGGNAFNVVTQKDINTSRRYGVRGKLLLTPVDTLKVTAIADYLNTRETVSQSIFISSGRRAYPSGLFTDNAALAAELAAVGVTPSPRNNRAATDVDSFVRDENYGASLTADLELGDYGVTSITAWRQWLNDQTQDWDGLYRVTPTFASGLDTGSVNLRQFSQELRLTSPKGELIDYVLGAYFLRAKTDERYQRVLTQSINGVLTPTTGIANYGILSKNYALFGEANVNFTERFRAIAGYRSVWDDIDFYHVRTSTNDPTNSGAPALDKPGVRAYHNASGSTDRRGDSYRLGLQYELNDDVQTYFTYSRGYKGPAFNVYFNMRSLNATTPLDEIPLNPETSKAYEAGIKGITSDRSVSYSLAVYNTDFDGYQANFNDVIAGAQISRLINAGQARSRGVEADVTLRPTKGFAVDISASYNDAKVVRFNCPVGAPSSCDINGKPLPYAPKVRIYGNAAYRFPVSDGLDLELQSDIGFSSAVQYNLTQTPSTIQPAYAIWNASVALFGTDSGWQVRGYVKNITDTSYASFLTPGNLAGTVRILPRDDRRYGGIMLRKDF